MIQVFQDFRVGRGGHRWLFKIDRPLTCCGVGYKLGDKCLKRKGERSGKREDLTNGIKKRGHTMMVPWSG